MQCIHLCVAVLQYRSTRQLSIFFRLKMSRLVQFTMSIPRIGVKNRSIVTQLLAKSQRNTSSTTQVVTGGDEDNFERHRYQQRVAKNEPLEEKKARLLYQSRKRGTLENDLLLASFAQKYLHKMNEKELEQYDYLINTISNEWDIYYWAVGVKPIPAEYDNSLMKLFVKHVKNEERELRIRQPDL